MPTDPNTRHATVCALIDKSLTGAATPEEELSLRRHLPDCPACSEYLEGCRRAVAGLDDLRFDVDPALDGKVFAALALRAHQLEVQEARRRRMGWAGVLALVLTAVGSFVAAQIGGAAAPALHLDLAQLRLGLTAFWITPSLCVCLLLLLLPASLNPWSSRKGVS